MFVSLDVALALTEVFRCVSASLSSSCVGRCDVLQRLARARLFPYSGLRSGTVPKQMCSFSSYSCEPSAGTGSFDLRPGADCQCISRSDSNCLLL